MKSNIRAVLAMKANNFRSMTPTNRSSKRKLKAKDTEQQSKIDEEYDKFIEEWEETRKFSIYA
jgi:hypothetical protein